MTPFAGHPQVMLTEFYLEALLVNEELADQVWEALNAGEIDDQTACVAWKLVANTLPQSNTDSN